MTTTTTGYGAEVPVAGMDVLEAIYTTRAMRRLKPDPIPRDVLRAVMDAAIRGPSGGNSQGWSFVVVTDKDLISGLADIYRPAIESLFQPGGPYHAQLNSDDDAVSAPIKKIASSALYLGQHLHEAPAIVIACIRTGGRPTNITTGSSIYPAVQNLMVAARAFGLGSTITTVHRSNENGVRELLGIPPEVETAALIPLGYPKGRWGVAPRRPLEEVVFDNHWSKPFKG